jgi:hypothetical protein
MRSFQGGERAFFDRIPLDYNLLIPGYYPSLISLYRHLDLRLVPTHFTFSFSRSPLASPEVQQTYFIYNGANGLSIPSLPSSAWSSISAFSHGVAQFIYSTLCFILLLLLSFLSWHRLFPSLLGHQCTLTTLRNTLSPLRLDAFIDDILVPIFSSVGTMTTRDVLGAPLPALLDYVHATLGTDHYALGDGCSASTVADRLVRPIPAQGPGYLRLGACIVQLTHDRGDVIATLQDGEEIAVDKVVLATQASSAKALLQMLRPSLSGNEERRVESVVNALEGVEYRVRVGFCSSFSRAGNNSSHTPGPIDPPFPSRYPEHQLHPPRTGRRVLRAHTRSLVLYLLTLLVRTGNTGRLRDIAAACPVLCHD